MRQRPARLDAALVLATALVLTATPTARAQEFPENLPQAPWFRQFQQELRAAWVPPATASRGPVRFVVGNDQWLPGSQFKSGGSWLALACSGTSCKLVPATLSAKPERAPSGRGQRLAFQAADAAGARVVAWFLAEEAPAWLAPRPVPSYYAGDGRPQGTGVGTGEASIALPKGEAAALVPMLLTYPPASGPLPPALLLLRVGERRQLLLGQLGLCSHSFRSEDYLLWAGDLDGDGKPDFLVRFGDGDGPMHLYLSSAAKPGRLVGLAGVYNAPFSAHRCPTTGDEGQEEG